MRLPIDIESVKGFLDPAEGEALYQAAFARAPHGACLEIGSYCGKSTVWLGAACQDAGGVLYTIDHHRGSEEMQPGWEHHDPETWDAKAGAMDTLPFLRDTLRRAGLEECVVPMVGRARVIARHWTMPLSFLFVDGGHTMENALADYHGFAHHVMPGGMLAIHDVFPDPRDGGRPPFEIFRMALASGHFIESGAVKSLRILLRR